MTGVCLRLWLALLVLMGGLVCGFAAPSATASESRDIIATASDQTRVALVIGNNAYVHVTQLQTAVADAHAIKIELEERGFDVVYRENVDLAGMNQALVEFTSKLSKGAVGMVYYAGHGVGVKSENYLLPVDIQVSNDKELAERGIPLRKVLQMMRQSQAEFSLAVIDACRNDPFPDTSRALFGSRSLKPVSTASGVMVVYSAGTDQQALDGLGNGDNNPNGLFTREFLSAIRTPGLTVQDMFHEVARAVKEKASTVGHTQTPAIYDESQGTFYFSGTSRPAQVQVQPPPRQTATLVVPGVVPSTTPLPPVVALGPKPRAGTKFRECSECPEMIVVPAGSFTMGSPPKDEVRDVDEGPAHRVTFKQPFAVGIYAITRGEFQTFAKATNFSTPEDCYAWSGQGWRRGAASDWRTPGFTQSDKDPVVCVTWAEAMRYVSWLNSRIPNAQQVGGQSGGPYRLLTEAEWEYSARAGTTTRYFWGDAARMNRANCIGCGGLWDGKQTSPVGSFAPNAFGLHDMLGNVWQWVADCYREDYTGAAADGSAWMPTTCQHRVDRGGSWSSPLRDLRVSTRGGESPTLRGNALGLRVARTLQ